MNPWDYSEGFDQGVLVEEQRRMLFLSGQAAVGADGEPQHPGDMRAQSALALDNVKTVLAEANMSLANIVRINTYATDVDAFAEEAAATLAERLAAYDVRPPGVLIGVTRLARPELLVELEVVAAD